MRRYCSTSSLSTIVKTRIESEKRLVVGGTTGSSSDERRIPFRLLRCRNCEFGKNTMCDFVPAEELDLANDDKSVLLADAYHFFESMHDTLGLPENTITDDTEFEPFGLLKGYDDKYDKSSMDHEYGAGLSCWSNGTISARRNVNWYLLPEGGVLPEDLALVQDQEDNHRLLTNLVKMKKKDFISKIKQFETQNWKCIFKIHNISNPCANFLSRNIKKQKLPQLMTHGVGSKKLAKVFDAYFNSSKTMPAAGVYSHFSEISQNINLSGNAPLFSIALTMLQIVETGNVDLINALFAANTHLFDDEFKTDFLEIAEIRETKTKVMRDSIARRDCTTHKISKEHCHTSDCDHYDRYEIYCVFVPGVQQVAQLIADKMSGLKSFDIYVPLDLVDKFNENLKDCENYPLPIMLNKEWLLLTLGFRGLEKELLYLYNDDEIADEPGAYDDKIREGDKLEILYDKFLDISRDMIVDSITIDGKTIEAIGKGLQLRNGVIVDAQRMEAIVSLMSSEQHNIAVAVREAFYLNQLCDFIFGMRDGGLDDGYKIKIDAIFSQDDIQVLKGGINSGLITVHKILQEIEISDLNDDCAKLVVALERSLGLHHLKHNKIPKSYGLWYY